MTTQLFHNPSDLNLSVGRDESSQLLFIFDQTAPARLITVQIEERASVDILAWVVGAENTTMPLTFRMEHNGSRSRGSARVRAILRGNSRNTFTGNVVIPIGAQNVESFLEYRAILFDHARATATPALEIVEHPLKAGHAATIGRVNDEQLFYLQSRGLTTEEATELITAGFFQGLISQISDEQQKDEVTRLVSSPGR